VIAVARRLDRLSAELGNTPGVRIERLDLSMTDELSRFLDGLVADYGFVPYVINNAGVNVKAPLPELDPKTLARSFAVNAIAPALIMRYLLPLMAERGFGRVINITSGAPFNCFPGFGAYSASKGALNALTVTAANEYEEHNIKVNLMSPGPVRTEMAPQAEMDPSVCHPTVDYLLSLDHDGPTGRFYWLGYEIPLRPDHEGIDWLRGTASDRFDQVVP
jgi:NAD(P)-dependent dehydrogenase (short-subunit alcohol dehydrogenase family)